jgi:hypothetical protein
MSKFDEALEVYQRDMKDKMNISDIDSDLLTKVAKGLGPSIYNADASMVSCSDQEELDRVKNNFLIKKLGLEDNPTLDEAIKDICETMGKSNRNKHRAAFYYLLVQKFDKASIYA